MVMVDLLFSVLYNLGWLNIKAAELIFSNHIVLVVFFSWALSRKRKACLIYRAIQLPQLGMEEGAWPTDLGVGS